MIPIRDDIPSRTPPIVNYTMIAICSFVFLLQLQDHPGAPSLVEKYGMIPLRISQPDAEIQIVVDQRRIMTPRGPAIETLRRPAVPSAVPPVLTMLTCVFLHGGWMHFLGNMWFLHIFGDNVEDRFGHVGYALFYLFCGVAASFMHFVVGPTSDVPTIGASGAIAGVMGAYFVWYRHARVHALVPLGFFLYFAELPAPFFLGFWFLIQFFQGTISIMAMQSTGVAWWAHIGGFVAGVLLAQWVGRSNNLRPLNSSRRQRPRQIHVFRR